MPLPSKNALLQKIKGIRVNARVLAFCIPFFSMLMVMLFGGYEPFGNDRCMLYSDMYHQYYPFFVDFRENLLSGKGLLYNWDIGMGLDYLGLISYYLGSPLNLLSLLLPESLTLEYFSLLVPIKLGLASLFFTVMLQKLFGTRDVSTALFGSLYGLCAWALGYQWNVMWLDTFALLPLVILGEVSLLKERRFLLYTLALFLSVLANYYVGLFTCIFVFLCFWVYEICRFGGVKKFLIDLGLMAVFSVLALGMTAFLELPAYAALQDTYSTAEATSNELPDRFSMNIVEAEYYSDYNAAYDSYTLAKEAGDSAAAFRFGAEAKWVAFKALLEGMGRVAGNMGGGASPTFVEGMPNIYCGVGTVLLGLLFLFCGQVKLRDKLCGLGLLVFFTASFLVRKLDFMWHGFHFPNQIPYRFSFLFSFVLVFMAYRAWLQREKFRLWQVIAAGALSLCLFCFADQAEDIVYLAYNLVFLTLYLASLLLPHLQRALPAAATQEETETHRRLTRFHKQVSCIAMCAVLGCELVFGVINFGVNFPYTGISNYPMAEADTQAMVEAMYSRETEAFFRAETAHEQILNDSALNGYSGISTFTSSANRQVTEFAKDLGMAALPSWNRYTYRDSSPVANLFLNVKYLIAREGYVGPTRYFTADQTSQYFTAVSRHGKATLLENTAYLPLGFLANSKLATANFGSGGDKFLFQNRLLKLATDIQGDVWQRIRSSNLTITAQGVELLGQSGSGYASFMGSADGSGFVTFQYAIDTPGYACLNISSLMEVSSFTVAVNGQTRYQETGKMGHLLSIGDVAPGDTVTVRFMGNAGKRASINVSAAIMDADWFRQAYEVLSASTLELTRFESTHVEGTIDCNRDGLLYTSIPQNGNWHAYVDGREVAITLVGDTMIAVPLTQGRHNVAFRYENRAFQIGCAVSLICTLFFAAIAVPFYRSRKRRGKFEKKR